MDHLQRLRRQFVIYLFLLFTALAAVVSGLWLLGSVVFYLNTAIVVIATTLIGVGLAWVFAVIATSYVSQPINFIWDAILHVSPEHTGTAAPNIEQSTVGHELVASLIAQVYQLASGGLQLPTNHDSSTHQQALNNFPLPVVLVDKNQNITYANATMLHYLGLKSDEVLQKNLYSVFDMLFPNEQTLDSWLTDCRTHKATDIHSWERVRLKLVDQKTTRQFDLAAYYTKDNPTGLELILTLFDHSDRYNLDDQAMGYVAIAVHELRTPLTILRGYIEVFEEEFAGKLTPELDDFMHKMKASAQQLAAFVNNILNVARIDENQLVLHLTQEKWDDIVKSVVSDMALRAQVHGKTLEYKIAANLPPVAAERVSIYEVLNNLIDNAIKYSGASTKIVVLSVSFNLEDPPS